MMAPPQHDRGSITSALVPRGVCAGPKPALDDYPTQNGHERNSGQQNGHPKYHGQRHWSEQPRNEQAAALPRDPKQQVCRGTCATTPVFEPLAYALASRCLQSSSLKHTSSRCQQAPMQTL